MGKSAKTASQSPILQTYDVRIHAVTPGNGGSGQLYVMYLGGVVAPLTVANCYVYVGTQSGNVDVAVGTWVAGVFTRLKSAGSTAVGSGTAGQVIAFPYTFQLGIAYWAALITDNATATFDRIVGSTAPIDAIPLNKVKASGATFPIPASESAVTTADSWTFWMAFQ